MDNRYYRFLFWPLWFIVVPLGLALGTLVLLAPSITVIEEQKVPAVIVLFTVYELIINHFRHSLPFATQVGATGRAEMSSETRRAYEHAGQLLEEAQRILKRNKRAVMRDLSGEVREDLAKSLSDLRSAMQQETFDEQTFSKAYEKASDLVARHLSRWQRGELREYTESILIAVGVALLLRAFVVEAFKIPSGSMLPTLQIQDHIFVNKFAYGPTIPFSKTRLYNGLPPMRGDVIVFEFPDPNPRAERQDFIKRVMALPGDTLDVMDGHPTINGWKVPNCEVGRYLGADLYVEYLSDYNYLATFEEGARRGKQGPYVAKPGEVWVMGDNRDNSHDSRAWSHGGGVPFANIKGRAMFVWLSFNESDSFFGKVTWDRLFTNVMGAPRLPKGAPQAVLDRIQTCLAQRPQNTFPPDPG